MTTSSVTAPAPQPPTSRVVHLPRRPVAVAPVQGTLALELEPLLEPPAAEVVPLDPRRHRGLHDWVVRFAQAAVEIAGGDRPAEQLVRHTDRETYADLHRRALLVARAGCHRPGLGRVMAVRPRVHSVRLCFLATGVAEASVHVRHGERSRALAARFELRHDRWVATALEFG